METRGLVGKKCRASWEPQRAAALLAMLVLAAAQEGCEGSPEASMDAGWQGDWADAIALDIYQPGAGGRQGSPREKPAPNEPNGDTAGQPRPGEPPDSGAGEGDHRLDASEPDAGGSSDGQGSQRTDADADDAQADTPEPADAPAPANADADAGAEPEPERPDALQGDTNDPRSTRPEEPDADSEVPSDGQVREEGEDGATEGDADVNDGVGPAPDGTIDAHQVADASDGNDVNESGDASGERLDVESADGDEDEGGDPPFVPWELPALADPIYAPVLAEVLSGDGCGPKTSGCDAPCVVDGDCADALFATADICAPEDPMANYRGCVNRYGAAPGCPPGSLPVCGNLEKITAPSAYLGLPSSGEFYRCEFRLAPDWFYGKAPGDSWYGAPAGLQANFRTDPFHWEVVNAYDTICFGATCYKLPVLGAIGPVKASVLSTGHTLAVGETFPSSYFPVVAVNLTKPTSPLSLGMVTETPTAIAGDPVLFEWILQAKSQSGGEMTPTVCAEDLLVVNNMSQTLYLCWFESLGAVIAAPPLAVLPEWWPAACAEFGVAVPLEPPPVIDPPGCSGESAATEPFCKESEDWQCPPGEVKACQDVHWLDADGKTYAVCVVRIIEEQDIVDGAEPLPISVAEYSLRLPDTKWQFVAAVNPKCGGQQCFPDASFVDGAYTAQVGSAVVLVESQDPSPGEPPTLTLTVSASKQIEAPWWDIKTLAPGYLKYASGFTETELVGLVFEVADGFDGALSSGPCVSEVHFQLGNGEKAVHHYDTNESRFEVGDPGACVQVACDLTGCETSTAPDGIDCTPRYPGLPTAQCSQGVCPSKPTQCSADWMCADGDVFTQGTCLPDGNCNHTPVDTAGCPAQMVPLCAQWEPIWPLGADISGAPQWICPLSLVAATELPPFGGPYPHFLYVGILPSPELEGLITLMRRWCGPDGACYWKQDEAEPWAAAGFTSLGTLGFTHSAEAAPSSQTGSPSSLSDKIGLGFGVGSNPGQLLAAGHFSPNGEVVGEPWLGALVVSTPDGQPPKPSDVCLNLEEPGLAAQLPWRWNLVKFEYDSNTSSLTVYWPNW